MVKTRWFCGDLCDYQVDSEYDLEPFLGLYTQDRSILLDNNNKPFEEFMNWEYDFDSEFIRKTVVHSYMISKGLENGISMDIIRNTYGQIIQVLDDKDFFDNKKIFKMNEEDGLKYITYNPELNLGKRYQFVFNEDEMEQILQGFLDGISVEVLKDTYCKFEIFEKDFEDVFTFKYKEAFSLYNSHVMAFARFCLKEGLDIEKVKFLLQVGKDYDGNTYNIFTIEQMKAIYECFKSGLSISNMNDFLAFRDEYLDGSLKNVCICNYEEILEAIELFK